MIPQEDTTDYLFKNGMVEETIMPSLTYKMLIDDKRIYGKTDDKEALLQAIYKQLRTERYSYPVYEEYGIELNDLFGKPKRYVYTILCERIKECLEHDDRILEVKNFTYNEKESKFENLSIYFDVFSIYGETKIEEAFNIVF